MAVYFLIKCIIYQLEGQQLQQGFVDQLFDNTTQEDKKIFIHVMKNMDKNLDDILKGGN